ncbi:MAG: insulinase family protein [Ignavibacteria bacterium]|nr:insulinase family protein [Ignavibacteria bacterium]
MKILFVEDHSVPSICYYVFFKAGSKNERPGITGISHLFEHMMFNGSAKFKPTEFDHLLEENGGYSNGSTWNDFTNYWEELNSDKLELVLDLESDRMKALKLDEENLEQERYIVMEERRLSVDNNPTGKIDEELYAHAFIAHPYQFPVIGWMGDLENIKLEDAKNYFKTYYAPNNATVILTGDFDTKQARKLFEKYFGSIPSQTPPTKVNNAEPEQRGEKRIEYLRDVQLSSLLIGYKSVAVSDADFFALDLLSQILAGGQSSRLVNLLINELQLATEVRASQDEFEHPGLFKIFVQARQGVDIKKVEEEIYKTIEEIKLNGVRAEELEKVKNSSIRNLFSAFKTNQTLGFTLGFYQTMFGNYKFAFTADESYKKVSLEDIKNVANKYLLKEKRTVVTLIPSEK